jgi:nuclease HARBI1
MSRIVYEVSFAIAKLRQKFVYMPRTATKFGETMRGFYEIGSFPNVIGTIDCTHVKIIGQVGDVFHVLPWVYDAR